MIVREGEVVPRWYGVARRDWSMDVLVCYPVPFNLIMYGGHWLLHTVRFPSALACERAAWRAGYQRARDSALREDVDKTLRIAATLRAQERRDRTG